jgi:hypothetical protein
MSPAFFRPGTHIRIASINIDGVKSNAAYVEELLRLNNVICLQEHLLYRFEAAAMFDLFENCEGAIKCFDDHDPMPLRVMQV